MSTEDMDDCPVCERETVYDDDRCTVCGRLWGIDYDADDITERLTREKAERIARSVADDAWNAECANTSGPERAQRYALRLNAARAAALAALIEKENAS